MIILTGTNPWSESVCTMCDNYEYSRDLLYLPYFCFFMYGQAALVVIKEPRRWTRWTRSRRGREGGGSMMV